MHNAGEMLSQHRAVHTGEGEIVRSYPLNCPRHLCAPPLVATKPCELRKEEDDQVPVRSEHVAVPVIGVCDGIPCPSQRGPQALLLAGESPAAADCRATSDVA